MTGIIVFISVFVRARNFQMPSTARRKSKVKSIMERFLMVVLFPPWRTRMTIFVQIRLIGLRVFSEIIYYIYH
jgi:hypothetical protein